MSDFALISQAIPQVFTVYNMLLIFGGLILGMVIGCVPGLSVTLGIILMLRFALFTGCHFTRSESPEMNNRM